MPRGRVAFHRGFQGSSNRSRLGSSRKVLSAFGIREFVNVKTVWVK
jgi:hypothetical protein